MIRERFNRLIARVVRGKREPEPRVVAAIRTIARRALQQMYAEKGTDNDLYNQRDAYGYAIYYDGKLVHKGFLRGEQSKAPDRKRKQRGRQRAESVIADFRPESRDYVLLLTNAMFYSVYHERKGLPIISHRIEDTRLALEDLFSCTVKVSLE